MADEKQVSLNRTSSSADTDSVFRPSQQRKKRESLEEVPGFTMEELEEQGMQQRSYGGFYYSKGRRKRHIFAQMSLIGIYEFGRYIVNSGIAPAYAGNCSIQDTATISTKINQPAEALETLLISSQEMIDSYKNEISEAVHSEMKNHLLSVYHGVERWLSDFGVDDDVVKRVQALLPYKVALDHMNPEILYAIYTQNLNNSLMMTIDPRRGLTLPNGGRFETDHAINAILSAYVANNLNRFRELMTEDARQALTQPPQGKQSLIGFMSLVGIGDITISNEDNNDPGVLLGYIMGPRCVQKLNLTSKHRSKNSDELLQRSGSSLPFEWIDDKKPNELECTQGQTEKQALEDSAIISEIAPIVEIPLENEDGNFRAIEEIPGENEDGNCSTIFMTVLSKSLVFILKGLAGPLYAIHDSYKNYKDGEKDGWQIIFSNMIGAGGAAGAVVSGLIAGGIIGGVSGFGLGAVPGAIIGAVGGLLCWSIGYKLGKILSSSNCCSSSYASLVSRRSFLTLGSPSARREEPQDSEEKDLSFKSS